MSDTSDALIIVDVQYDFCPGGNLPVPHGDEVIPVLNAYLGRAVAASIPIFASRDYHPPDTAHFAERGGIWPVHCVQGTQGAELHSDLHLDPSTRIVTKGDSREDHGYSAFEGRLGEGGQTLAEALREAGVTRVFVGGLATDYCVLQTVLDACREGLVTVYLQDASRPVEVNPGDGSKAEDEMRSAGAQMCTLQEFQPRFRPQTSDGDQAATGGE
jgi:nicotinamidase/pyrazinamidase